MMDVVWNILLHRLGRYVCWMRGFHQYEAGMVALVADWRRRCLTCGKEGRG